MLNKMIKMRNKKGFTLIELIVVLVIMAIIAAMAVPAMMGYINEAKKSTHLANCRAVYIAAQADITVQLSTAAAATTTNMAAQISKMVPDIKAGDIVFDAAAKDKYFVELASDSKSVKSVTYQFGTTATDAVVLTPGNGTNILGTPTATPNP